MDGNIEMIESLVKTTLAEMEKLLTTKTVVGEPMTFGGRTLIPLISIGFGFGAGGGSGKSEMKQKGEGMGGGTGGGGGVKPVAVIIIDNEGIKIEPIRGGFSMALEKIGESLPQIMEKCMERFEQRKKEE